ncbi:semaphorin-7A-like [Anabas testudineus]|uniref:Sema domain-containing protein n=1 Tax=Anabas testudineus TaxID=64144 RepID=A0A3Q1HFB7_ANATE|nr:semaphorin-7A-like [Anabas testudineus]
MAVFPFKVVLLLSCLSGVIEANSTHLPRMIFKENDTSVERLRLPTARAPVGIFMGEQPDTVMAAGPTSLNFFNFQTKTPVEKNVSWVGCTDNDCSYNIAMIHKMEAENQVFLCGTNGEETLCCDMNLSDQTSTCNPSKKIESIHDSIKGFIIKEREPSALVESAQSADLYVAYSGSQEYVGIHKFGENRVRPPNHDKEQHYVSLMPIRERSNPLQDKVYAFYKEKNKDTRLDSEMWLPFVTRICMADLGGPKNNLQFSWTSQMNARLFCGDPERRQYFSELVDVATVQAEQWEDTRVYALFRNEWGTSAVCVYTMGDINKIFETSLFKDCSTHEQKKRLRTCVEDSRKIVPETLRIIEKTPEMVDWVRPADNSGPLLFNHHNYTHIYIDSSQNQTNRDHTVLFLSLSSGGIHKVMHSKKETLVIAEYQLFPSTNKEDHIFSMTLHPTSRKLYVSSERELVQLDVANCPKYGGKCECFMARDPYCGWNGNTCVPETHDTMPDITGRIDDICRKDGIASKYSTNSNGNEGERIMVPAGSKYFLQCPISSHHAQYTWHHHGNSTSCKSKEQHCLILINSMDYEQQGTYKCVSEELGYTKVVAQYKLDMIYCAACPLSSPLIWICLLTVLLNSLNC